jgi:hypothetical protein
MGMVKKLWSISALSVELDRDRRTVAKFLRGIPADGQINGHDAWHLQTALNAMGKSCDTSKQSPMPLDFEVLEQARDPLAQGVVTALLSLVYGIGPLVASLAVAAGAPMRVSYALHDMMTLHCAAEAEEFCASEGIIPRHGDGSGIFHLAALQQTDWEALAKLAGEPVDKQSLGSMGP